MGDGVDGREIGYSEAQSGAHFHRQKNECGEKGPHPNNIDDEDGEIGKDTRSELSVGERFEPVIVVLFILMPHVDGQV